MIKPHDRRRRGVSQRSAYIQNPHSLSSDNIFLFSQLILQKWEADMSLISFNASQLWQIGAILSVTYLIRKIIVFNRLRKFRGPPGTGFTNFFHSKAYIGPKCHEWYTYVNEKYGKYLSNKSTMILPVLITRRSYCEGRTEYPHYIFPRSLDSCEYQADVQAIRLVLSIAST